MANSQMILDAGNKLSVMSRNITELSVEVIRRTFFLGNLSEMYPPIRFTMNPMITEEMRNAPAHTFPISEEKNSAMNGMTAEETARLKKDVISRTFIF